MAFLTDEQRRNYGTFTTVPDDGQLAGYFLLDRDARRRAMACRGARSQLGYGVQLGTVRFLGAFLDNPEDAPAEVVAYVADQLGHPASVLAGYGSERTRFDHRQAIKDAYGYTDLKGDAWWKLVRWLWDRCWSGNERPIALFDLATLHMVEKKVLLPGATVLERLVSSIREHTNRKTWRTLAAQPDAAQRAALTALLPVEDSRRTSKLDRLRRSPRDITGPGAGKAIDRFIELNKLGASGWDLSGIPAGRLTALSRYASSVRAKAVADLAEPRRMATLVAFAAATRNRAADEAIEVFDILMSDLARASANHAAKQRMRTLGDLDAAALMLREAWITLSHSAADPDSDVRSGFDLLDITAMHQAARTVGELARPEAETIAAELTARYRTINQPLRRLAKHLGLESVEEAGPLMEALKFLPKLERTLAKSRQSELFPSVPVEHLGPTWQTRVFPTEGEHAGGVDKHAWIVGTAEALRGALRRHDVFVPGLDKWGDPRKALLQDVAWENARTRVCRSLGLSEKPGVDLNQWCRELDGDYRRLAAGLADNPHVRIEQRTENGKMRDHLVLTGLDKLTEPASLKDLREAVDARIPTVDLPELLLEVHAWTGFLNHFHHVSEAGSRAEHLIVSLAAVLVAEACNIGIQAMVSEDEPGRSRDQLFWVEQNYLRAETLRLANAVLVDYQATLPIVGHWGGGELASADGLRFATPLRVLNSGPNPKYFAARGITLYNYLSDQYSGFNHIVIPGTRRDSLYLLDGILDQPTSLNPTEIATDTAGASEMIFGLFRLLGYQFSPRLADAGHTLLYRADPTADYGPLNPLTGGRIRLRTITDHWDDLLRLAGSLREGTVRASQILPVLAGQGRPSPLGRAVMQIGRLDRSAFLARYYHSELFRRKINNQLNRQESRHELARRIFYGQKGELRQKYKEGQEDQLSVLGLVLNTCILWNSVYIQEAVNQLRAEGHHVSDADLARLSPLGHDHIRMIGRYHFRLSPELAAGKLRPLRTTRETVVS
ncbi:Tn3 family transposase [Streptomyces sp. HC307]|uniref:Tn3 family transposase n=1 Tax=Streptomyces flavusporus TaxID=3385496 RepID=UPI0039170DCC